MAKQKDSTKNSKSTKSTKTATNKSSSSTSKKNTEPKTKQEQIKDMQTKSNANKKLLDEIWAVVFLAIGVFLIFTTQFNTTGELGEIIHDVLRGLFGIMAYVLPYYFIVVAILLFAQKMQHLSGNTAFFSILIFVNFCSINAYRFIDIDNIQYGFDDILIYYKDSVAGEGAGAVGMEIGSIIVKFLGKPGLLIVSIALIVISLLFVINTPISSKIVELREKHEEKKLLKEMEKYEREKQQNEERIQRENEDAKLESLTGRRDQLKSEVETQRKEINNSKTKEKTMAQKSSDSSQVGNLLSGSASATSQNVPVDESEKIGNKNRKNFIDLSEELFKDPVEKKEGIGLRDQEKTATGSAKSYGLDADGISHEGFGLAGYADETLNLMKGSSDSANVTPSIKSENFSRPPVKEKSHAKSVDTAKEASITKSSIVEPVEKKQSGTDTLKDAALVAGISASTVNLAVADDVAATPTYEFPSIDLLNKSKGFQYALSEEDLNARAQKLEQTLKDFNVDAKVVNVTQGASVTRYEVQPSTGVKVNKITGLADDIALNMRAKSIRIEAPIPGKPVVGIEVENEHSSPVLIRELIDSDEFKNANSKLAFAVGKDISGNNVVADLRDMPHLLIAGATGSGKSVCINTIITSLLYRATPDEVKLILIDPKVVELGIYNGIPHLLVPVVTDPKKAAAALNWAVTEMDSRYLKFAEDGVKDLISYNELAIANHEPEKVMPEIVIIIDELADLMMAAPSQVEDSICRLAQKARAAGMHLILATQRPSVNVVTGLIKANIPSRIAFSVSSQIDSRTIIDMAGAEKLLGKGDMLFSPVGSNKPYRIQGPFITGEETARVIEAVKGQKDTDYSEEVINRIESSKGAGSNAETPGDELTEDAIAFILKQKQASVSMLQRRFRIGYNRAARIIDEIEERGIIGPSDGSRPRQVFFTEEEYYGTGEEKSSDVEYSNASNDESDQTSGSDDAHEEEFNNDVFSSKQE